MEINFKKVHTGKDLAISSLLLIAGIGIFFLNKGLGALLVSCAVLMLLLYRNGYRIDGHGAVLTKQSEDLCRGCRTSLMEFLKGKDTTPAVVKGSDGGCIRLDVYFNRAEGIAYAQLFDFCDYTYEPATEIIELQGDRMKELISQL